MPFHLRRSACESKVDRESGVCWLSMKIVRIYRFGLKVGQMGLFERVELIVDWLDDRTG